VVGAVDYLGRLILEALKNSKVPLQANFPRKLKDTRNNKRPSITMYFLKSKGGPLYCHYGNDRSEDLQSI
jgi:hypothetical protein